MEKKPQKPRQLQSGQCAFFSLPESQNTNPKMKNRDLEEEEDGTHLGVMCLREWVSLEDDGPPNQVRCSMTHAMLSSSPSTLCSHTRPFFFYHNLLAYSDRNLSLEAYFIFPLNICRVSLFHAKYTLNQPSHLTPSERRQARIFCPLLIPSEIYFNNFLCNRKIFT